ncbi:chromatin modification- protein VID21 [Tieghemiomyces parasiticus]|uniref:Vacuolar import and degradation protein 21 n=1 Tax=Tieghemiomyces parasiticus TaxID=78921 RepID=A0A9W8A4Z6_9FUNG|nr:chromatin modification- protein VID21 [Tieghemiomyces parasiticus]
MHVTDDPTAPNGSELETGSLKRTYQELYDRELEELRREHERNALELYFWKFQSPEPAEIRPANPEEECKPSEAAPAADPLTVDWDNLGRSSSFREFLTRRMALPDDPAPHPVASPPPSSTTAKVDFTPVPLSTLQARLVKSLPVARHRRAARVVQRARLFSAGRRKPTAHRRHATGRTLDLYGWQYKVQHQPLAKALQSARKFLTTGDWRVARDELRAAKVLRRVETLKSQNLWSFRQMERHEAPARAKTHWDFLLDEMQWLQADFKEERRFKVAVCYQVGRWVLAWHAAADKTTLCVKGRRPENIPSTAMDVDAQHGAAAAQPSAADWLTLLDPNAPLVHDPALFQTVLAHFHEHPLLVPPVFDEHAAYEDTAESSALVPVSHLMNTLVGFAEVVQPEDAVGPSSPHSEAVLSDLLAHVLAEMAAQPAAFTGESECILPSTNPAEARDVRAHPDDYELPADRTASFGLSAYDGGYTGDLAIYRPARVARDLPGTQRYAEAGLPPALFTNRHPVDPATQLGPSPATVAPPDLPSASPAAWTPEADTRLQALVEQYGGNWSLVASALTADTHLPGSAPRNPRDCYDRWRYLSPHLVYVMPAGLDSAPTTVASTPIATTFGSDGPPSLSAAAALAAGRPDPTMATAAATAPTLGAEVVRGQRLQSFAEAIAKAQKKRQEIQTRTEQALASRPKRISALETTSNEVASADASAAPAATTNEPGNAGDVGAAEANGGEASGTVEQGDSIPATPTGAQPASASGVAYRSPLELSAAKQELDVQMAQITMRQRSLTSSQWAMQNLARSMMGRAQGPPNRPLPVRPPTLPMAGGPSPAGVPSNFPPNHPAALLNASLAAAAAGSGGGPSAPNLAAAAAAAGSGTGAPAGAVPRLTPEQMRAFLIQRQQWAYQQLASARASGNPVAIQQATAFLAAFTSSMQGMARPPAAPSATTPGGLPAQEGSTASNTTSTATVPTTAATDDVSTVPGASPPVGAKTAARAVASPSRRKGAKTAVTATTAGPSGSSTVSTTATETDAAPVETTPTTAAAIVTTTPTTDATGTPVDLAALGTPVRPPNQFRPPTSGPPLPNQLSALALQFASLTPAQKLSLLRQQQQQQANHHYQQMFQHQQQQQQHQLPQPQLIPPQLPPGLNGQQQLSPEDFQKLQQAQQVTQAQLRQHLQRAQLAHQQHQQQHQQQQQLLQMQQQLQASPNRPVATANEGDGSNHGTPGGAAMSPSPGGTVRPALPTGANPQMGSARAAQLNSLLAARLQQTQMSPADLMAIVEKQRQHVQQQQQQQQQQHASPTPLPQNFNADKLRMYLFQQQQLAAVQAQMNHPNAMAAAAAAGLQPQPSRPIGASPMMSPPRHGHPSPVRPMMSPMSMPMQMMGSPPSGLSPNLGGPGGLLGTPRPPQPRPMMPLGANGLTPPGANSGAAGNSLAAALHPHAAAATTTTNHSNNNPQAISPRPFGALNHSGTTIQGSPVQNPQTPPNRPAPIGAASAGGGNSASNSPSSLQLNPSGMFSPTPGANPPGSGGQSGNLTNNSNNAAVAAAMRASLVNYSAALQASLLGPNPNPLMAQALNNAQRAAAAAQAAAMGATTSGVGSGGGIGGSPVGAQLHSPPHFMMSSPGMPAPPTNNPHALANLNANFLAATANAPSSSSPSPSSVTSAQASPALLAMMRNSGVGPGPAAAVAAAAATAASSSASPSPGTLHPSYANGYPGSQSPANHGGGGGMGHGGVDGATGSLTEGGGPQLMAPTVSSGPSSQMGSPNLRPGVIGTAGLNIEMVGSPGRPVSAQNSPAVGQTSSASQASPTIGSNAPPPSSSAR